ncbi:endopeptidase, partial [Escherichia coli]|nr:endopeptidase [Escherichia coli]
IKKPVSWIWQTQPLLICRCASAMLLRSMQNTRGN